MTTKPPAPVPAPGPVPALAPGPEPAPALTPVPVPDEVAWGARVRVAEWLTGQAPRPELAVTPKELAGWTAYSAEEDVVVLMPPGYADLLFLVADHGITPFAPSRQTLEQALVTARSQS